MNSVWTIGYEGAELDDFVATLKFVGIEQLIDIREFAGSRRKGFSKSALAEKLEANNISYYHLKSLGDPKEGRDAARNGDIRKFRSIFNKHMRSPEAKAALDQLKGYIEEGQSCLLCYERDHKNCHRSIVADKLASEDCEVVHIGVRAGISSRK